MSLRPRALLLATLLAAALPAPAAAADTIPMGWRVARLADAGPAGRRCLVTAITGDLTVRFERDPETGALTRAVRVGADAEPGSLRYLRIGRRLFQSDRPSFQGAEADEIAALLTRPGRFVFEWLARPGAAKHGGLYGTGDFAEHAAACERWVGGPGI